MKRKDDLECASISKGQTLDDVADYWDAHSLAEHWDATHEVQLEVRAMRRRRVTLDPQVYAQIETEAHERGISPETLVNLWLAEHIRNGRAA